MVLRTKRFKRFLNRFGLFRLTDHQFIIAVCLVLTVLLAGVELLASMVTNSLLLSGSCLVQLSLTGVICPHFLCSLSRRQAPDLRVRLGTALLNGFFLLLFTFYLFLEVYLRLFQTEVEAISWYALPVAVIVLAGNYVLIRLMVSSGLLHWKFGSYPLPVNSVQMLLTGSMVAVATVLITGMYMLDALLASFMGAALFAWAGFSMMDAYWRILEVA